MEPMFKIGDEVEWIEWEGGNTPAPDVIGKTIRIVDIQRSHHSTPNKLSKDGGEPDDGCLYLTDHGGWWVFSMQLRTPCAEVANGVDYRLVSGQSSRIVKLDPTLPAADLIKHVRGDPTTVSVRGDVIRAGDLTLLRL